MVVVLAAWAAPQVARAQQAPPKGPVGAAPTGAPAEEAPEVEEPPPWCGVRPAMSFVVVADAGKRFFLVEGRALTTLEALLASACPGDKVRIASFGLDIKWHGGSVVVAGKESREQIAATYKRRGQLSEYAAINDNVVKAALKYWEESLVEGELPVLVVFTDTIESAAPKRPGLSDFGWTAIPDYFQGKFLTVVGLFDHRSPRELPSLYITTAPPGMKVEDFPNNPRATFEDLMKVFIPEPEPVEPPTRVVIQTVEKTMNPDWLVWLGTTRGSLTAGGAVFTLLTLIFLLGRFSRRQREKAKGLPETIQGSHKEVTLLLLDRLTGEVLRQETRVLRVPMRVTPGSDADFVVPGPYAFEIADEGGESPVVRPTNMLGVELKRGVGRRLIVPEGESMALRQNDRVDIGSGHEVEIQLH